jgi:hypothetical protein
VQKEVIEVPVLSELIRKIGVPLSLVSAGLSTPAHQCRVRRAGGFAWLPMCFPIAAKRMLRGRGLWRDSRSAFCVRIRGCLRTCASPIKRARRERPTIGAPQFRQAAKATRSPRLHG